MDSLDWKELNKQYRKENGYAPTLTNNMVLGIIGALVGAFIGAATIVLIGECGYVSFLGGIVMAFCTLKGYEILCTNVERKGVIACIVIMILMAFGAEYFQWAFDFYKSWKVYGYSLAYIFPRTFEYILDYGCVEDFLESLGLTYVFTAIGAIGVIRYFFPER